MRLAVLLPRSFFKNCGRDVFEDAIVEAKAKAGSLRKRGQRQGQIISDEGHVQYAYEIPHD